MRDKAYKNATLVIAIIIIISTIIFFVTKKPVPGLSPFALAALMWIIYLKEKSSAKRRKEICIIGLVAVVLNVIVAVLQLVDYIFK